MATQWDGVVALRTGPVKRSVHCWRHCSAILAAAELRVNQWEENLRLKQPFRPGTHMNFQPGSRLEILDAQTVRFHFPEPDGAALIRLASLHIGNRQFYSER